MVYYLRCRYERTKVRYAAVLGTNLQHDFMMMPQDEFIESMREMFIMEDYSEIPDWFTYEILHKYFIDTRMKSILRATLLEHPFNNP
jgi:hypothetical protein